MSLCAIKWTLFQAKCSGDSDSQLVLLWPDIRDCCFCCSVSLQCKSTGDEQQEALKAASPGEPSQALSYHAVGPLLSWGGGVLGCLSYCCCRWRKETVVDCSLSINLGTALQKA